MNEGKLGSGSDLEAIERTALKGLREQLMNESALSLYASEYNAERRRLAANAGAKVAIWKANLLLLSEPYSGA